MAESRPASHAPVRQLPYAHPTLSRSRMWLAVGRYAMTLFPAAVCLIIAAVAFVHFLFLVGAPRKDLIDLGKESAARGYALVIDVWLVLGGLAVGFGLVVLTVRRAADAKSRAADDLMRQVPLASKADE